MKPFVEILKEKWKNRPKIKNNGALCYYILHKGIYVVWIPSIVLRRFWQQQKVWMLILKINLHVDFLYFYSTTYSTYKHVSCEWEDHRVFKVTDGVTEHHISLILYSFWLYLAIAALVGVVQTTQKRYIINIKVHMTIS